MLWRLQLILLSLISCLSCAVYASVTSGTFLKKMMQQDPVRAQVTLDYLARVENMQSFFITASIGSAENHSKDTGIKRSHEQSAKIEHCISKKIKATK